MMAKVYEMEGRIVNGHDEDELRDPLLEDAGSLKAYVLDKCQNWRDFTESNYYSRWDEFYRLWRGLWAEEDSTRKSERSRIITPALQQAVESSVAEVEEATFGHGSLFDIRDDVADQDPKDVAFLRDKLTEEFQKQKIRRNVSEVLINAAVYGTGVAEITLDEIKDMRPAVENAPGGLEMVGTRTFKRPAVNLRPVQMKNFLIDPVATCVQSAHGVAIDEFVPMHYVEQLQENGTFKKCTVGVAAQDTDIEPDPELDSVPYDDKVRLLKYYGLVPRHLLEKAQRPEEDEDADIAEYEEEVRLVDDEDESYYVEAVVVIANEENVLKCEENSYMMQDRPVVAFQWDIIPGMFWGRGVCEKGYNSQKALDAEVRARIDALAITTAPMLAMDATRIPRGHTPQVRPGKMLLTNGNPNEILREFNFGSVSQINFAQAAELQKMVQQSTGAMDGAEFAQGMGSNNKTGAVSMAMGALIKRHKRTLLNFQDTFWLPFVEKAAWRYMQFDSENFPVKDYKFVVESSLGTMGREYQVSQLGQLLQTTSDKSPMYGTIVKAIVNNMDVPNREELLATLDQAAQPNPEEVAMQKEMHQMEMDAKKAQIAVFQAQANESNARAQKYKVEAALEPRKVENDRIDAVADVRNGVETADFKKRLDIANTRLKERGLNIQEKKLDLENKRAEADRASSAELNNLLGQ